jgi:hydroxymethylpyrimidine/phosphomethylpyrimidine kinase
LDPSSGAGVTADLKVFAAHGLYGVAAITALTVQSTQGVRRTEPVEPTVLEETLNCLAEDFKIAGVKIGMLATGENVAVVSRFLRDSGISREKIVLDPVIRSSSGRELLDQAGLERLAAEILPLVGWVTPNVDELGALLRSESSGSREVVASATRLQESFPHLNVVATGGDADPPNDFLLSAGGSGHWIEGTRIETRATHGTGCTFSSALLAALLNGSNALESVNAAKHYVEEAMLAAYEVGKGYGPLHHLYMLDRNDKP